MNSKKTALLVAGLIVVAAGAVAISLLGGGERGGPGGTPPPPPPIMGRDTGQLMCDDGTLVPANAGTPQTPSGPDQYKFAVPGHGTAYRWYQDQMMPNLYWARGKVNPATGQPQIDSPFSAPPKPRK